MTLVYFIDGYISISEYCIKIFHVIFIPIWSLTLSVDRWLLSNHSTPGILAESDVAR